MSADAKSEPGYFRIPNQPAHIKVLQRFNVSITEKSPRLFSCHFVATAALKATLSMAPWPRRAFKINEFP
jgi:hypothetical protein